MNGFRSPSLEMDLASSGTRAPPGTRCGEASVGRWTRAPDVKMDEAGEILFIAKGAVVIFRLDPV